IDLSMYNNIQESPAVITLPALLEKIVFLSDDYTREYNMRIIANEKRSKDLEVDFNNVNIYSRSYIGVDIRGLLNQTYKSIIRFSGNNTIRSSGANGILVTHNQTMNIIGSDAGSVLNVQGGMGNAGIGNSEVINLGGNIIFSGSGTVNAIGGKGRIDGGFGIGFAHNTEGSSSITIKCNAKVYAAGGDGKEIDSDDPNVSRAGNGGDGISLGDNGSLLVEKCPQETEASLKAVGGNGGIVTGGGSILNRKAGGNGGDGISIVSGTISINGITEISGGNGTSPQNADSFGIQGGDGGYAIVFLEPSEQKNHLIIGDDSYLKGGDGGNSGVAVDFSELDLLLIPLEGGRGGNVIEAGSSILNAVLGSGSYISGNGGKGGSPAVYGDVKGMSGADMPGDGGSSGSIIHGTEIVDLIKSQDGSFVSGTPGSGGIGVDSSGNEVVGSTGTILKQFDIIERSSIHFGYVNLRTAFIFSEGRSYIKNILNNYKKYKINIHQIFQNCFNIEQLTVQNNYDLSNPKVLNGSLMILLLITSCITPYEKTPLPVNTESYTNKNRES
ncbi:MAG: hemagglutinin, partial [Clostridium sp.]|nr:hemagglutinin [Clostridium sp.]